MDEAHCQTRTAAVAFGPGPAHVLGFWPALCRLCVDKFKNKTRTSVQTACMQLRQKTVEFGYATCPPRRPCGLAHHVAVVQHSPNTQTTLAQILPTDAAPISVPARCALAEAIA